MAELWGGPLGIVRRSGPVFSSPFQSDMILIADGGSTKSSWCQLDEAGNRVYFNTEGYNPIS